MHTIELFEHALTAAQRLGYQIRYEQLGGTGGGACEYGGRKWLFIDLGLNSLEQLDQVLEALRDDPQTRHTNLAPQLRQTLGLAKAA